MNKIVLSENHRRSISSSVLIIEKMMTDIEKAIFYPSDGVISRTINDIHDLNPEHFASVIKNFKMEIDSLVKKYNLRTEEVKLSRIINSRKAKMWETVTDTFSKKLKGYKEFPKEIAAEFDADLTKLQKIIDSL